MLTGAIFSANLKRCACSDPSHKICDQMAGNMQRYDSGVQAMHVPLILGDISGYKLFLLCYHSRIERNG